MDDPYLLDRFVSAQDAEGTYVVARAEIRAGKKTTHWMWFVFPQLEGLGESRQSRRYAIGSLEEARAYLAHPLLGPRIIGCAAMVATSTAPSAEAIFGAIDAMKLRSSMTLFADRADPESSVFPAVLDRYFSGATDPRTDDLLRADDRDRSGR